MTTSVMGPHHDVFVCAFFPEHAAGDHLLTTSAIYDL
jgi:hypothetical protein